MKRIYGFSALVAAALSICACSSSMPIGSVPMPRVPAATADYGVTPNDVIGGGHNKLLIRLGDVALPSGVNLTQVNLGIDAIYLTDAAGRRVNVAQYSSPQVVNVLQYQNGSTFPIASASVPTTTYSSMTLVIDMPSSSVLTASGVKARLAFRNLADQSSAGFGVTTTTTTATSSSASAVAITFRHGFAVAQSGQPSLDVDFNAFESLLPVPYASTAWTARASLSVAQAGLEGAVTGQVVNASGKGVQNAVVIASDTSGKAVASSFTNSYGAFLLHTLARGTYKLTVYNKYTTAAGWHIAASGNTKANTSFVVPASVQVVPGETIFVETIAD